MDRFFWGTMPYMNDYACLYNPIYAMNPYLQPNFIFENLQSFSQQMPIFNTYYLNMFGSFPQNPYFTPMFNFSMPQQPFSFQNFYTNNNFAFNNALTQFEISNSKKTSSNKSSLPANGYSFSIKLNDSQKKELATFKQIYTKNKSRYDSISERIKKETGKTFPSELIAAIHYRESGCNFNTYLHNGQKLGQKTTLVPKGIYFDNFEDAAVDAIKRKNLSSVNPNKLETLLDYAERYNGLGYRRRGVASPYVWAGTDKYTGGMFVADSKYSPTAVDKRLGIAVMLKSLKDIA